MKGAAAGLLLLAAAAATAPGQDAPEAVDPLVAQQRFAAVLRQATRHYDAGEYQAALDRLNDLPPVAADELDVLNLRGAILTKLGDYDEARRVFAAVMKSNPGYFPSAFNIGELQFLEGNYEAALETFRGFLDHDPRNELVRFKIVICNLKLGRDDEARKAASGLVPAGNTPAWYYAQAMLARKAGDAAGEAKHLSVARAIYEKSGCQMFDEAVEPLKF